MALLPGSPAIDAGNNSLIPSGVTTDQRGFDRIVNGTVDIGAFEFGALPSESIYILDATAGGALSLSGNATINVSGSVVVDSSSSSAIKASGNAQVTAAAVLVAGGVSRSGNASVTKTGPPGSTGDPLAGLTAPTYSGTPVSETLSGNSVGHDQSGRLQPDHGLRQCQSDAQPRHLHHRRRWVLGVRQRQRHRDGGDDL